MLSASDQDRVRQWVQAVCHGLSPKDPEGIDGGADGIAEIIKDEAPEHAGPQGFDLMKGALVCPCGHVIRGMTDEDWQSV